MYLSDILGVTTRIGRSSSSQVEVDLHSIITLMTPAAVITGSRSPLRAVETRNFHGWVWI